MSIIDLIAEAGVVGVGGAGFPTHAKYKKEVEYLIVNAAECEPLLQTDKYAMKNSATEIIIALEMLKKELEFKHVVIATKADYQEEIVALEAAIEKLNASVTIHKMKNYYPTGDEFVTVFEVTGRVVPPAGLPLMVGCVVSNVSTILNIYYAKTQQRPVTTKRLTVTGLVAEPTLLEVPIGTPLDTCLNAAGGTQLERYLFLNGGPMMGRLHNQDDLSKQVVTKTTSGLIITEEKGYLRELKNQSLDTIMSKTELSCIQCHLCTDLCPRQKIGHDVSPHKVMKHFGLGGDTSDLENNEVLKGSLICSACGVCEVIACPRGLSPRQVNNYVKGEFGKAGIRYENENKEFDIDPLRSCKTINGTNILVKMGMLEFAAHKLNTIKVIDVDEVFIPLHMHIGAPSVPTVKVGDQVEVGDLIAKPEGLGANIHASIAGKVMNVNDHIHIKKV